MLVHHLRFAALAVARTGVQGIGVVAFLLASCSPSLASQVLQSSLPSNHVEPLSSASGAQKNLAPEGWARLLLERCRALAEERRSADEALTRSLESLPASREQAAFLSREAAARSRVDESARRAALSRLNVLLGGNSARFPDRHSGKEDSFRDVLTHLLGREDPCAIERIEATILFGLVAIPFDEDAARHAQPNLEFGWIDGHVRNHLEDQESLEQIFAFMRPDSTADVLPYVEAVIRQATSTGPLYESGNVAPPDFELRLRQLLELVRYAAEPVRIQIYLHAKVNAVEGALGAVLPEGSEERLFQRVEAALYSSVDEMRDLRQQPPRTIVATLDPIVDTWFQRTALPALRRFLAGNPFAAYWFFVQSGGVTAAGPAFSGSRVQILQPAFALTELAGLRLSEALQHLETSRVSDHFLEQHRALESAFTDLTLSPAELPRHIERLGLEPDVARKVHAFMVDGSMTDESSSLDAYRRIIRDASKIGGRLDRDMIRASVDVITAAKADRLEHEIQRILAGLQGYDPQLLAYLRADAQLMLELEQRQALESAFRMDTSGAAVGWLLSQFFIGGSVPVALWAPQGVMGAEFGQMVDELVPENPKSGNDYAGKPASEIQLVHDGSEYRAALIRVIDSAEHFLNISSFDWKTDTGGREIAYRLMAKKLGIDGEAYTRFLAAFERGLPMDPARPAVVPFYDIPTTRMKDLLVTYFILTSEDAEIVRVRAALREAGATLECSTVLTCGDLNGLTVSGTDASERPVFSETAWRALQQVETLFADRAPPLDRVRPRRALRDYCEDPDGLRRFVRRFGLRRADRPADPFEINIVADAKQNIFNVRMGEPSQQFPYFATEPIRDIYFMLLEFEIRVVLWKGALEFPWHLGPVPVPGRKMFGVIPMPFVPWPWLRTVNGFGWAGPFTSVFLQYLMATDPRIWWGMVNHTKSWSSESTALESGMGMASKYFNQFDEHRTWHDMGVLVRGGIVNDVNDHFVQVFNQARRNNTGLPSSRGARIPNLGYHDYRGVEEPASPSRENRSWLLTTHPEQGDSNYRGVFVAALASARHNIYIENSFFSDPLIARMLIHKAREFRGRVSCAGLASYECAQRKRDAVRIHLVLPDSSDKPVVDAVGTADFHEMLHLGIKVYRWRPDAGWSASRMLHSKVWLIDFDTRLGGLTYVGAANATQRSHLADNEAGILSSDPGFARQVYERVFERDMTTDSRVESEQSFHVVRSSSAVVGASRWLRRLLVELFWFI